MSVTPINKAQGSKLGIYLRRTLLALVGIGSTVGGAGGYLHLNGKINETNTQLTKRLEDSEASNAKIAKLELDMSTNTSRDKENKVELGRIGSDLKSRVNNLESKVSISELQDVYNKALPSTALLEIKIKRIEEDGKGGKVEGSHIHSGSAVIVAHIDNGEKGGYIATNWHVIQCEALKEEDLKDVEAKVTLPNGNKVKAKLHFYKDKDGKEQLARKIEHDLILLKTTDNISQTKPVPFAQDEPKVGEAVMVIGNPFGSEIGNRFAASFGIISGDSQIKYEKDGPKILANGGEGTIKTIRTDASTNPGNSGGLGWRINDGKMVFMPGFIFVKEGASSGVGFGLTASTIINDVKIWIPYDLNENGVFTRKKDSL